MMNQVRDLHLKLEVIQSKYEEQILARRKLHNQIEDMKGKIRVYCRVRPLT
jgi:chromosome segregation ATPase